MLKPLPFLVPFYLDDVGVPLTGGKLYTWNNNTQVDKPTWKDPLAAVLNTNPIILNGGGRFDLFCEPGLYTMRLTDFMDQLIWERDNVTGQDDTALITVETIADMKALVSGSLVQVNVLGYNSANDGGGGLFIYNPAISIAEDGGVTFIGIDAPASGRWVRMNKDEISIRYFGAVGDGVTDDKIAIENAIAYCISPGHSRTLYAPTSPTTPYIYLMVTNPTGLDGSFGQFTFRVDDGAQLKFSVAPTVKCNFKAGSYRIFAALSADPLFAPECTFEQGPYPEWWGAVNDGTGDQLIPINAWLNCQAPLLYTSAGIYEVSAPPAFPAFVMIISGGKVTQGVTTHIKRGIRQFGGTFIEFEEMFGGEITAGQIIGDPISSLSNSSAADDIIAGRNLIAQAGTSTQQIRAGGRVYSRWDFLGPDTDGVLLTDLMSFLVPANMILNDGDTIRVRGGGTAVAGPAYPVLITMSVYFGGTLIIQHNFYADDARSYWHFDWEFTKVTGVNKIVGSGVGYLTHLDVVPPVPHNQDSTVYMGGTSYTVVLTADALLQVKAQCGNVFSELVQKYMQVDYIPAVLP
jgi:hypothetical protein